jgi:hypothetical protein
MSTLVIGDGSGTDDGRAGGGGLDGLPLSGGFGAPGEPFPPRRNTIAPKASIETATAR